MCLLLFYYALMLLVITLLYINIFFIICILDIQSHQKCFARGPARRQPEPCRGMWGARRMQACVIWWLARAGPNNATRMAVALGSDEFAGEKAPSPTHYTHWSYCTFSHPHHERSESFLWLRFAMIRLDSFWRFLSLWEKVYITPSPIASSLLHPSN
jgi:hypothetical protein